MRCDSCQALMINGVFCHETGCPNTKSRYDADSDTWIKQYKCPDCGCMADEGESCCAESDDYECSECEGTGEVCEDCGESLNACECGDDAHIDTCSGCSGNGYRS